jgi:hypothetical protein
MWIIKNKWNEQKINWLDREEKNFYKQQKKIECSFDS